MLLLTSVSNFEKKRKSSVHASCIHDFIYSTFRTLHECSLKRRRCRNKSWKENIYFHTPAKSALSQETFNCAKTHTFLKEDNRLFGEWWGVSEDGKSFVRAFKDILGERKSFVRECTVLLWKCKKLYKTTWREKAKFFQDNAKFCRGNPKYFSGWCKRFASERKKYS